MYIHASYTYTCVYIYIYICTYTHLNMCVYRCAYISNTHMHAAPIAVGAASRGRRDQKSPDRGGASSHLHSRFFKGGCSRNRV